MRGSRSKVTCVFNFASRWSWVVRFSGRELLDCTDILGVWVRQNWVWTCWRSENFFKCQAISNTKITHVNLALILKLITLVILSVPTIETANIMRSSSNQFCRHCRSYIWTRRSLIGMPSYELPLVRGWDNSISHLGSTASIGTSQCIPIYRLSIDNLLCKNGPINSC